MSYVPPPTSPGAPQPARPPGRRELWYGIGVGLFACLVLPFLGLVGADALGIFGVGLLTPLAVLVAGVVLTIPDRTRQWGIGLLIGFLVSLILGAGVCVAILATWNYGG
jgi:hypothetical protein